MPAEDRTGKSGLGRGTGRAQGCCFGYDTPCFAGARVRGTGSEDECSLPGSRQVILKRSQTEIEKRWGELEK